MADPVRTLPLPDPLSAPRGLILYHGEWKPRRIGYVPPGSPIMCRRGHVIQTDRTYLLDGVGAHVCRYRHGRDPLECLAVVGAVEGSTAGSFRFDLTIEEWAEIQRRGWRAQHILDYVGAAL